MKRRYFHSMSPKFSIVIPVYNAAATVAGSVLSALGQEGLCKDSLEVVAVDDCSTDGSGQILAALAAIHPNLRLASTPNNGGPGIARNIGITLASGDWLVFLDSDDHLTPTALAELQQYLHTHTEAPPDAIGFNWCFAPATCDPLPTKGLRRDHEALTMPRDDLLRHFLRLQMDGSVIYTAIRRALVTEHRLRFASGYHEDVDFIFKVYWLAQRIDYVDRIFYIKQQRPDSIVSTVSVRHLEGFLRAWEDIARFIAASDPDRQSTFLPEWQRGLTGVIATRLREISRRASSVAEASPLYTALYQLVRRLPADPAYSGSQPRTQYEVICQHFQDLMGNPDIDRTLAATQLDRYLKETVAKTWSCTDLHHSVFLAPDQIRTCCKRFFVNGSIRGDVPLLDVTHHAFTSSSILAAKCHLHEQINKAEPTPCDGCPFMEFKEWGPLDQLDIHYLSLEYHSVCNLKCTYCSETYYGGFSPRYDIAALVSELLDTGSLKNCGTIVWGGGEPVVDKHFVPLIEKLAEQLPQANQRVLTNAVKHSKTVENMLAGDQITVTTSIDAGTSRTFDLVRGKAKLQNVLATLKKYASVRPERVTIKYIFTAGNHSLDEIRGFAALVAEHRLTSCNFQISSDFKDEAISPEIALAMIVMYGLLSHAGVQVIFFDDLLRHRLSDILASHEADIRHQLASHGLEDVLADSADYPAVTIWGAGWQARYMLQRTAFFKRTQVAFFVDQTPSKIGTTYLGHPVCAPEALIASNLPVIIAGAQSFPIIYRNFQRLGIDPQRLVRRLIL